MLTAAIVIAGWIAGYFVLRWILQRNMKRIRMQLEKKLTAQHEFPATAGSGPVEAGDRFAQITAKNISALGQSLSALMGQEVHIRAIKKRPISSPLNSPWAREGCVLVQNSHELEIVRNKTQLVIRPMRASSSNDGARRKAA